jgi:hypothetical protein
MSFDQNTIKALRVPVQGNDKVFMTNLSSLGGAA